MPLTKDRRIWHKAARFLSGQERLNIHFINGDAATTNGRFSRHENEFGEYGLIQLTSTLEEDQLLRTFLHEVAHAKHHWDATVVSKLEPTPIKEQVTSIFSPKSTHVKAGENLADKQRDEWLEIINSIIPEAHWTNEQKLNALVKFIQRSK